MGDVITVLGPVSAQHLGIVLPHEHLLLDLTCLWGAPRDPSRTPLIEMKVTAEAFETLSHDPYQCLDNLRLDDTVAAVDELALFAAAGGATVVDLSSRTIGPYPDALRTIAGATGLNIVASTGYYVRAAHPQSLAATPTEAVRDHMVRELTEGFAEAPGVRAGIIGEIGTSSPIHPDEERVLRAAAAAQRQTGVGLNVHLAIFHQEGHRALDILESAGADLSRVALSHLDEQIDTTYHLSLARRGVFLEFDTFGSEAAFEHSGSREPSDGERLGALCALLDRGLEDQVMLAQDVCTKMQWTRYGGRGYAHVLRTIVPALKARGVSGDVIDAMLRRNPARLLAGE